MPVVAVPLPSLPPLPTNCPPVTENQCGQLPPQDITPLPVSGCHGLRVISAPISTTNGQPILSRMKAVKLMQNQVADVAWTFQDENSRPIDLSDCTHDMAVSLSSMGPHDIGVPGDFKFVFRMREYLGDNNWLTEVPVDVVDPANGKVLLHFSQDNTSLPGVYFGELILEEASGTHPALHSNVFYVHIQRNAASIIAGQQGPPGIAEIRLFLRDSNPAENYLLDNIKFDDAEIAYAIVTPLDYWNEVLPPLPTLATTSNFPFRHHWMRAIAATLFRMAAEQYRSNNLSYSAAGVSIDDQNKEPNYQRAADDHWSAWVDFVKTKKRGLNAEMAYGEVGSPYGWLGW